MGRETHGHYSGLSLGSVRLHERIGGGGMGEIYKGYHDVLDMDVAVKVILPGQGTNEELVKRFIREARASTQLSHPNILKVFNADKQNDIYYIVMEFVDGTDLKAVINRHKRISWMQTLAIVEQAALGLAHAHKKGIVHRDIKPDNLLMTRVGEIKIADFGLATLRAEMTAVTTDGTFLGTPLYMSPEQCEGITADWRADIYSLGATWYHLLTGRPPYIGDSPAAVIAQHMVKDVAFPDHLFDDVPPVIVDSLAHMMARNRDARMQSLEDLVERLRELSSQSKVEQRKTVQQVVSHTRRMDGMRDSGPLPVATISGDGHGRGLSSSQRIPAVSSGTFPAQAPDADEFIEPVPASGSSAKIPSARPLPPQVRDSDAAIPRVGSSDARPGAASGSQQPLPVADFGAARRSESGESSMPRSERTAGAQESGRVTSGKGGASSSDSRTDGPPRPWQSIPGLGQPPAVTPTGTKLRRSEAVRAGAPSRSGLAASSSSTHVVLPGSSSGESTVPRRTKVPLLLSLLVLVLGFAGGVLVVFQPPWLFPPAVTPQNGGSAVPAHLLGPWVYFVHRESPRASNVWRVRPDGEQLTKISQTPGNAFWPAVSPDGRRLAYVDGHRSLYVSDSHDGSNAIDVFADAMRDRQLWGPLSWRSTDQIAFLDDNRVLLQALDGRRGEISRLMGTNTEVQSFVLDKRVNRIVFDYRINADNDLGIEDRPLSAESDDESRRRIAFDLASPVSASFAFPRVSFDGTQLVALNLEPSSQAPPLDPSASASHRAYGKVVVAERDGQRARTYELPGLRVFGAVAWLPDGRLVFAASDGDGQANLYVMSVPQVWEEPNPRPLLSFERGFVPEHVTTSAGPAASER